MGGRRAALRRLGLPARARAEVAGGGGGEGWRVLVPFPAAPAIGSKGTTIGSKGRQPGSPRRRKGAVLPLGRRLARARARLLPVAARAGTGASGCDATFLVGISSRRSIGAAEPLTCSSLSLDTPVTSPTPPRV